MRFFCTLCASPWGGDKLLFFQVKMSLHWHCYCCSDDIHFLGISHSSPRQRRNAIKTLHLTYVLLRRFMKTKYELQERPESKNISMSIFMWKTFVLHAFLQFQEDKSLCQIAKIPPVLSSIHQCLKTSKSHAGVAHCTKKGWITFSSNSFLEILKLRTISSNILIAQKQYFRSDYFTLKKYSVKHNARQTS